MFRGIAKYTFGDGSTMLFWSDLWNANILESKFPRLYSFARNKNISVARFLSNNTLEAQFHLPFIRAGLQRIPKSPRLNSRSAGQSKFKGLLGIHLGKQELLLIKMLQLSLQEYTAPIPFSLDLEIQML
jgi:hypothetical protein